jgi:hypothetical protein
MDNSGINMMDIYYFSNKNALSNNKQNEIKPNNKEFKFYKKRIFQLYKDLMLKKVTDEDLLRPFHIFNQEAIKYLKFKDKSSILQEEYIDLSNNKRGTHCFNSFENKLQDKVKMNDMVLMRDYNVKTKTISECIPITKKKIKKESKMIIPQKKRINLQDSKFKHKDLKKKNVNNNYEEKKAKNNEKQNEKNTQ